MVLSSVEDKTKAGEGTESELPSAPRLVPPVSSRQAAFLCCRVHAALVLTLHVGASYTPTAPGAHHTHQSLWLGD